MEQKKALLYCRTARHDSDALEMQKTHLTAYAEAQGFMVVGIVSESGSGLDDSRTGLREILSVAAGGGAEVLVVMNLSRLGRNSGKTNALLRQLRKHGVSVVCADGFTSQTDLDMFNGLVNDLRSSCAVELTG